MPSTEARPNTAPDPFARNRSLQSLTTPLQPIKATPIVAGLRLSPPSSVKLRVCLGLRCARVSLCHGVPWDLPSCETGVCRSVCRRVCRRRSVYHGVCYTGPPDEDTWAKGLQHESPRPRPMALLLGLSRVGRSLTMCWDTPVGPSHGCCQVVRWQWFSAHPLPRTLRITADGSSLSAGDRPVPPQREQRPCQSNRRCCVRQNVGL